ncbi:MAG: amidohydrolase [Chloroflexi bacterium]|nr:amidohydrolase [Chloroflexota bacterium]MCL5074725.1 amidohydrolase [Chloroflexota bacterium]
MKRLLIEGGSIYTCDPEDRFLEDTDIAISDGRIEAIGKHLPSLGAECLEATGKVVMPGLINCHTHLFLSALRGYGEEGELFAWLQSLNPHIAAMSEEDRFYSTYFGFLEAVRTGATCLVDCSRAWPYVSAQIAAEMGVRLVCGAMPLSSWFGTEVPVDLESVGDMTRKIKEQYSREGLVSVFMGAHSTYTCSSELLARSKEWANRLGIDFNLHLAESRREVQAIQEQFGKTPVQYVHDLGILDEHTIADHCVWLNDEDIRIFKESGARVAHCPISNAKLASGVAPLPRYLANDIPVGLGTDSMVSNNNLNMFQELKFSLLLHRVAAMSPEALTARQALRMVTSEAAKVAGLGAEIGSLEVGKRADMLILDVPHPARLTKELALSHLAFATSPTDINTVIIDGRVVVRDGRIVSIDEQSRRQEIYAHFRTRRRD